MADTRTIWIQACIGAIHERWKEIADPSKPSAHPEYYRGLHAGMKVLEEMLTAEPTGESGITVDGQFDQEPEKPVRTKFTAREMMDR